MRYLIVSNVTFLGPSLSQIKSDKAAVSYPLWVISVLHVLQYMFIKIILQANELRIIKYILLPVCQPLPPPFHESPVLKLNIIMVSVLVMNFPPLPLPLSPACTIKPVHKIYLTMTSSVMWKLKIKHLSN